MTDYPALVAQWSQAWPAALACWGPSLRLAPPAFLTDTSPPGSASFAWFDLSEVHATIDLRVVVSLGIADIPLPVLAHEIGHHVLAPADVTGQARIVERCRRGLVDRPEHARLVSNLWTDLLINDRLHRRHGLDLTAPYVASRRQSEGAATPAGSTPYPAPMRAAGHDPASFFDLYLRAYELLWSLTRGTLVTKPRDEQLELDARLLARHARVFARDPVGGAAGFAALMRRWLPESDTVAPGQLVAPCHVTNDGRAVPDVAEDDSLADPVVHPALDPRVNPQAPAIVDEEPPARHPTGSPHGTGKGSGQGFGPSDLAALYGALRLGRDAAVDWYAARARRHLVPFPIEIDPPTSEPELQGLETWQLGDDISDIDWLATATRSATVLPGLTTQRRVVERSEGDDPDERPVDLDLYVDSSGSMPNPRGLVSPAVLGGAVLVLSALRVGARVRVTSWASPGQVTASGDFSRDRAAAMAALLTYHGGGTSFPLAQLAAAHHVTPGPSAHDSDRARRCHIAVLSDDGVSSLFGQGQPAELAGAAHQALDRAGGGGTLVLQVTPAQIEQARAIAGDYAVIAVQAPDDIVGFAKEFARRHWQRTGARGTARRR
ncbi:hypothetical protein BA895_17285 [Humibacillus sp. DSM 29435]|uniref:DUF58 domain-containing protein n=1 Tax=Humibacillus sp. DSM 29435 TaxID=1869167 RepID=UPI000872824E|nr:DUF58 domain-containing protein [Humibacillus sp. DSM 29435]OFE17208.1 hypothetical protein BA895_17285 [Humibacillus sp. DSM 29435]